MIKRAFLFIIVAISIGWTEPSKWEVNKTLPFKKGLTDIVWTGERLIGIGDTDRVYSTQDFITWQNTRPSVMEPFTDIECTGSQVIVTSNFGLDHSIARTTIDGLEWGSSLRLDIQAPLKFIWVGNQFIFTTMGAGLIHTSFDGFHWISRAANTKEWLLAAAYSDSLFVAVGSNGAVTTSPDGITWTAKTTPTTSVWWQGAAWGNGLFVIVGDRGIIATSQDGIEWTCRNSGTTCTLNRIVWTGGKFLAVGSMGTVISSANGIDWEEENSGTRATLRSVICTDDKVVAVGDSGIVIVAEKATSSNHSLLLQKETNLGMKITLKDKVLQILPTEQCYARVGTVWLFNMAGRLLYSDNITIGTSGMVVDLNRYNSEMCVLKAMVGHTIINKFFMLR